MSRNPRAQSADMNSLNETKEFDKLKILEQHIKTVQEGHPYTYKFLQNRHVYILDPAIPQENVQPMERNAQTVGKLATSQGCVGSREPES